MKTLLAGLLAIVLLTEALPSSRPAETSAPAAERIEQHQNSEPRAKPLHESALEEYISSFRIESTLLIAKIASDGTKRAFMKMVEKAIKDMTEARQELTQAVRRYDEADSADLVKKLRLALAAQQKYQTLHANVLFSNSIMFGLTATTGTYADDELDARLSQVLTTADAPTNSAVERLLKQIENRLVSSR